MPDNRRLTGNPDRAREIGKETQFKPGQTGNAGGRPKRLPLTDQLREILEDPKEAKAIADALIKQAKKGSRQHFQELADRVEGKSPQRIELSGPDGGAIPVSVAELDSRIAELIAEFNASRKESGTGETAKPAEIPSGPAATP